MLFLMNLGFAGGKAKTGGGGSMTLAEMRAKERMQLRERIRRDDEQVIPIIIAALRRKD